mgnify:CR=1 FL=1
MKLDFFAISSFAMIAEMASEWLNYGKNMRKPLSDKCCVWRFKRAETLIL